MGGGIVPETVDAESQPDNLSDNQPADNKKESLSGLICGASAFMIWGASPVFWKLISNVPAFETIMHRVVWSFVFLIPFLIIQKSWGELWNAVRQVRVLSILLATSLFVSCNWLIYIWAINNNHVLSASLGYYINPLVSVFLGMVFLKEKLRPAQKISVGLAVLGVLYLTIQYGEFPWVALSLAFSFGFYGLIRKVAPVGSLVGLAVETMLLSIPASIYLIYLDVIHQGVFLRVSYKIDLCLMGTALVTALPLLLFTIGARVLRLSTVGFLQYMVPTSFFLLAIFVFGEEIHQAQIWSFVLIWSALIIYTVDSTVHYRRLERLSRNKRY